MLSERAVGAGHRHRRGWMRERIIRVSIFLDVVVFNSILYKLKSRYVRYKNSL